MPNTYILKQLDGDLQVRIRPGDVVGYQIYTQGNFEPVETRWLREFLQPGMTFFDVGANLGVFTLLAAKCVGTTGSVHSFEPSPVMIEELRANIALNALANVNINGMAVAAEAGWAQFPRYARGNEVYGTLGPRVWPGKRIVRYDRVQVTTLDEYVSAHNIAHVDLIKMDIEGAELLALKGARNLLLSNMPPALLFELAEVNMKGMGYGCPDVLRFLGRLGYLFGFLTEAGVQLIQDVPDDLAVNTNVVAWRPDRTSVPNPVL